jgi:chromosome partitioning protein
MFDSRNNHDNGALKELREAHAGEIHVFDPIGRSTQFDNAALEGRSTLELIPDSAAAQNFYPLADHLIYHGNKQTSFEQQI